MLFFALISFKSNSGVACDADIKLRVVEHFVYALVVAAFSASFFCGQCHLTGYVLFSSDCERDVTYFWVTCCWSSRRVLHRCMIFRCPLWEHELSKCDHESSARVGALCPRDYLIYNSRRVSFSCLRDPVFVGIQCCSSSPRWPANQAHLTRNLDSFSFLCADALYREDSMRCKSLMRSDAEAL